MELTLPDAVAALSAASRAVVGADVETVAPTDLLAAYVEIETALRRVPAVGHAILNRLDRECSPIELGATSWWKVLVGRCRISKGDAQRRLAWARLLGPRRTLSGEGLAPVFEHTAAAQADGLIGEDHVQKIKDFFAKLPDAVDATTRGQCEQTLANLATQLDPHQLEKVADRLMGYLHPDGELDDAERQRRRGLRLGKQGPDGLSRLSGWVSPELRAVLEPLLATFSDADPRDLDPTHLPTPRGDAAPDAMANDGPTPAADDALPDAQPDAVPADVPPPPADAADPVDAADQADPADPFADPSPATGADRSGRNPLFDERWRTQAQRTHDALLVMCRTLLCTTTRPTLNGLPVSVVVTTTLQDLEAGAGYAVTAGGTRLPITDLIRMAAHAHHYLAVFDKPTQRALFLGRTQRCATGDQKLMLFARDRGCTCPGCDAAGYATQAHHGVADWKHDGLTNVDDMTLACGAENRMIDTTEWTTRRRADGIFEWIPPPHLDYGQPRINHTHHPERLLADPDPPDLDPETNPPETGE